ncbi:hypothetical protein [Actinopolymorpha pittospori]
MSKKQLATMGKKQLRTIDAPFVALGPSGVAIRDRLKHLTPTDEKVLRLVGGHLGALALGDLKARCADGLDHSAEAWAERKQGLTAQSSSRWAGSITKASQDQWALSRRCQLAHIQGLEAGVATLAHRLSQPLGEKGTKRAPGGYASKGEWFHKSRRLAALQHRLDVARAEAEAVRVHVVRGGARLINTRHHLDKAQLSEVAWRQRWEAQRWFLAADGESGKRFGNETIRVAPDGEINIKLPAPLAHLANARNGRYVLAYQVAFTHRGGEWRDRISANQAVAYRIHLDVARGRWYLTAAWRRPVVKTMPLQAARAAGMVGVDTNAPLRGWAGCGSARQQGSADTVVPLTVCSWNDYGSVVRVAFFNRPLDESAKLLLRIRSGVEAGGWDLPADDSSENGQGPGR